MFDQVYNKPSFYALAVTGIIIFIILFETIRGASKNELMWLFLFGILVGIHGILHLNMEVHYHYNPLEHL
jgi:hypothetical protein